MRERIKKFRRLVWGHYRKEGRHSLPWRKTRDLYRVLVSEVMLQQTQVDRVIPFYKNFLKQFPTAGRLASAPLASVLLVWQGLGYNRRAKLLHATARELPGVHFFAYRRKNVRTHLIQELEELPGVGPYTARAVAVFAYNADITLIETNIRTAVIYHFYPKKKSVSDKEIEKVLEKALPKGKSREWHWALMDYGAHLKRSGVRLNARNAKYVKQGKFAGSNREARGAILREIARTTLATKARLLGLLGPDRREQLRTALVALLAEHLIQKRGRGYTLPH